MEKKLCVFASGFCGNYDWGGKKKKDLVIESRSDYSSKDKCAVLFLFCCEISVAYVWVYRRNDILRRNKP